VKHLPRRLACLALLWSVSGCVLPLAPEFEEDPNLPPYLVSTDPPQATVTMVKDPKFFATVQDPNENDTLYVRWLIDYPPYDSTTTVKQRAEDYTRANHSTLMFEPNCINHGLTGSAVHRLMLLVSDRPFLPPESAPDRPYEVTQPGTYPLRAFWSFFKECP